MIVIHIYPARGGYVARAGRNARWGVTSDEALGALVRAEVYLGIRVAAPGGSRKVEIVEQVKDNDCNSLRRELGGNEFY